MLMVATLWYFISRAVERRSVGSQYRTSSASSSALPSVAMGHRALENHVSNTSGSCSKPSPGDYLEATTSPSGPYHTGMRCPHQSCLETFQSRMFSSHRMVSRRQESG